MISHIIDCMFMICGDVKNTALVLFQPLNFGSPQLVVWIGGFDLDLSPWFLQRVIEDQPPNLGTTNSGEADL